MPNERLHPTRHRAPLEGDAGSVIQTGDLIVNLDSKAVEINGARVYLTDKEYQMLEPLTLRKTITITKDMFLNHLYGGDGRAEEVSSTSSFANSVRSCQRIGWQ